MSYRTDGITRVRIRPLAVAVAAGGGAAVSVGAVEAAWESTQADGWHQVYVNGRLAGVTGKSEDRQLVVSAPVGRRGPATMLLVEVVAVDAVDRWTDFGVSLSGFAGVGAAVRLTWQAGEYLDPNLDSFDVFADGRTGTVDYETPLNDSPIAARPGGQSPWGYGCGGYGVGGYGQSAAQYEWTTDSLEPGAWRLAVVAVDTAGNRLATAADVAVVVSPLPRPAGGFRLSHYDLATRAVTLAWEASPDV